MNNQIISIMSSKGGARPGAGRKSKAVELGIAGLAEEAIAEKYGSLKDGFKALLETKDTMLVKFVFEHAAGKPKETIKHEGDHLFSFMTIDPLSDIETNDSFTKNISIKKED